MQRRDSGRSNPAGLFLSLFCLAILLFYTYGRFAQVPYVGFYFNPMDGTVLTMYVKGHGILWLQPNDKLIKVGPVPWTNYYNNRRQPLFDETIKDGDMIDIIVKRGDTQLTIPWKIPGITREELSSRFFNIWWLAFIYWLFGSLTEFSMRPKDVKRTLLIAANYLTGLWVIFGSLSGWHMWESSILLHMTTWLILPVYLHLHWIFPKPLYRLPIWATTSLYLICGLFSVGEYFQFFPTDLYMFGFLAAIGGSMSLQAIHFVQSPEHQNEIGLLGLALLLVLAPFVSLGVSGISSRIAPFTFLALPFIPLTYFYVIYRRNLGGMEMRANRIFSAYAFLIILGTILLLFLGPVSLIPLSHESSIFLMIISSSATAFISTLVFPPFQTFVEKNLLGIKLPYRNLQETYSARITSSTSLSSLTSLLEEDVFPSLLVRQYAFMYVEGNNLKTLLVKNVESEQLPSLQDLLHLAQQDTEYLSDIAAKKDSIPAWIRLILPLKMGEAVIGFWLLGRRDPDDFYHQSDVVILQSIANQTAMALSNIQQTEQLRKMYQLDIERYEKERLHLALDLHDSILNQLAVLRTNLGEAQPSANFNMAYEELTRRLREIVSDLRPPMLMYGLKPAIEELADNLMERSGDKVNISVDIQVNEHRVPENIEQHLFRIVQETCENALRHAQAKHIKIYGQLSSQKADLTMEDDGIGFNLGEHLDLGSLLADNHFGLAGIIERVNLIGAEIHPSSSPQRGTKIQVVWKQSAN